MKKYVTNIAVICMTVILFFTLGYFVDLSFGIAHVALLAAGIYAIYLNIRDANERYKAND